MAAAEAVVLVALVADLVLAAEAVQEVLVEVVSDLAVRQAVQAAADTITAVMVADTIIADQDTHGMCQCLAERLSFQQERNHSSQCF